MYKVSPDRNIFLEIDNNVISTGLTGCSVSSINKFGLRNWFDVTKPLDILISKTKSPNFVYNSNRIKDLKTYFEIKYKEGEFPNRPTVAYLSKESNFSEDYIKRILSSERYGSRDFIIGMCFAFKLNIIESNLLLKSSGYNELYDKDIRDVIIIKCIYDNFINQDYELDNENEAIIKGLNDILQSYRLDSINPATSKFRKK